MQILKTLRKHIRIDFELGKYVRISIKKMARFRGKNTLNTDGRMK
jgi:hypothetical protein